MLLETSSVWQMDSIQGFLARRRIAQALVVRLFEDASARGTLTEVGSCLLYATPACLLRRRSTMFS